MDNYSVLFWGQLQVPNAFSEARISRTAQHFWNLKKKKKEEMRAVQGAAPTDRWELAQGTVPRHIHYRAPCTQRCNVAPQQNNTGEQPVGNTELGVFSLWCSCHSVPSARYFHWFIVWAYITMINMLKGFLLGQQRNLCLLRTALTARVVRAHMEEINAFWLYLL